MTKLHSREMTIVKVKLLNICARTPSSLEYITRGKKTQIVVSVLAVMAVIISCEPKTAAGTAFAPRSR